MTDAVIIARGERNDRAYVPDLPGCMATGKTREDTTRVMRDAIAFHRQGLKEDGLPIPEPTRALNRSRPPDTRSGSAD